MVERRTLVLAAAPGAREPELVPQEIREYSLRAKTPIEGPSTTHRPTLVFRCAYGELFGYVTTGMAVDGRILEHGFRQRSTDDSGHVPKRRAGRDHI